MNGTDYPDAIPMFVDESRVFIDANPRFAIVIHKTACNGPCTAQNVANFFANDPNEASTHYIVGQDGTVVQCVLEKDGAGGNCCVDPGYDPFWQPFVDKGMNLNLVTFSIEHCDPTIDNSTPCTETQKQASFGLVQYLVKKYNIPLDHIKGHNTIAPINRKNCPGNYPWAELMSYLQQGGNMGVPTGWHDDGKTLTAPNNIPVVLGFRDYVLNNNWDSNNWPLEPESEHNPLEESNPSLGQGARQTFRWKTLEYTPNRGVFEGWTGQELMFVRAQRDSLQATNAQLQAQIKALQANLPMADIQATISACTKLSGDLQQLVK